MTAAGSDGQQPTWHAPTAKALREALLPLSEVMPGGGGDGVLADPLADGPVIVAWSVDRLAQALASEMGQQQIGAPHACPDEPRSTLTAVAQFVRASAAMMKREYREGALWADRVIRDVASGEITREQLIRANADDPIRQVGSQEDETACARCGVGWTEHTHGSDHAFTTRKTSQ